LRYVLDLPVGPPVADKTFGDQLVPGMIELEAAQSENLYDRSIRIETSPLSVSHNHQKQIEGHRFMAQPMKISAMKDLMVDDGVAPCPSHGSIVE